MDLDLRNFEEILQADGNLLHIPATKNQQRKEAIAYSFSAFGGGHKEIKANKVRIGVNGRTYSANLNREAKEAAKST